ncbi:DUF5662 family protein [Saccharothrix sp. NRRL B-16348]
MSGSNGAPRRAGSGPGAVHDVRHHYAHNRHHPEHFADGINGYDCCT